MLIDRPAASCSTGKGSYSQDKARGEDNRDDATGGADRVGRLSRALAPQDVTPRRRWAKREHSRSGVNTRSPATGPKATGNIPRFVEELKAKGDLRLDMDVFVPKS